MCMSKSFSMRIFAINKRRKERGGCGGDGSVNGKVNEKKKHLERAWAWKRLRKMRKPENENWSE